VQRWEQNMLYAEMMQTMTITRQEERVQDDKNN
jgi:hypothetical protein